jgi:radical SAM protein with 4Fe4S-binding SPASM domain
VTSNALYRFESIVAAMTNDRMITPTFVDLHTSNYCNQNCIGCAYKGTHDTEIMSYDDHLRVIQKCIKFGVKAFDFAGGGEPTMIEGLHSLVERVRYLGGAPGLITNGTFMGHILAESLAKNATYVRFSLEASSGYAYGAYKQKHSSVFFQIIENIKRLQGAVERIKSPCQVSLKFSVSKSLRGRRHYQDIMFLTKELKPDRVYIKPLRHGDEELSEEERWAEHFILKSVLASERPETKVYQSLIATPKSMVPQCTLNLLHTVIDHKGDVYICCYYYYRKEAHKIGNILKQDFGDFWGSNDHMLKVQAINREECAKVDCKFFAHHKAVIDALGTAGEIWFL